MTFTSDAYTEDGGQTWRWTTNNAPCPLDACQEYGIPCNPALQKRAIEKHMDEVIARYKATQPAEPSAEEQYEMRAAFGPGKEVVDVITGRKWRT